MDLTAVVARFISCALSSSDREEELTAISISQIPNNSRLFCFVLFCFCFCFLFFVLFFVLFVLLIMEILVDWMIFQVQMQDREEIAMMITTYNALYLMKFP